MICRIPVSLAAVFILLSVVVAPAFARTAPVSNLRTQDAALRRLIDAGIAGSPSLQALAADLARTDVIVYVSCDFLPLGTNGRLTFTTAVDGWRYLHIQLDWHLSSQRRLSTLGHELQHALEIAGTPSVVDAESMARAFTDMGFGRRDVITQQVYDTQAAVDAGERVWAELSAASSSSY
jgi:hypothetical protein